MVKEHAMKARFRFYAELNDFLLADKRQLAFDYSFSGSPSIKDAIEAIGVPHPEVDLIVVNDASVGWDYHLASGDEVSVYPVFEAIDISDIVRLRPEPLRVSRFVLDVHLGRLAKWLRMLGFDSLYDSGYDNAQIIENGVDERRIILTRSRELLKNARVTHGYWVRATDPRAQIEEVVGRLDLRSQFAPFTRCMECNGEITERPPAEVADQVPPKARERAQSLYQCNQCRRVYWEGTHVERMRRLIEELS
jgi:uncharacterized protein with PIN domain